MKSPLVYTSIGLGLLLVVGCLDYLTGPEVSFFVFYFLPLAFVGWYTNRKVALLLSCAAAAIWFVVDHFLDERLYSIWMIQYWNTLVRLMAFVLIAMAFWYMQAQLERAHALNRDLSAALATVKKLSGLLPICASCKRIRNDQGYWEQIEAYIREHSEAEFTHGICPACVEKLYPELSRRRQ
jgi:hypothetical protein